MIDAQGKKPRLPVHLLATANAPVVRLIGLPDPVPNHPFLPGWLPTGASGWRREKISTSLYIRPTTPSPRAGPSGCPPAGERWPLAGENDRAQQGVLPF